MAVVDAGAARGAPAAARAAGERAECCLVEDALFRGRPGLAVVQMAWHPGARMKSSSCQGCMEP